MQTIGVIGGSGFYEMKGLTEVREVPLETPFGAPSGPFVVGRLGDRQVVFLARHGAGHRLSPSAINYRANVWGMKKLGVQWLLSVSAVGSLREDIRPGDLVVVDQCIDRTFRRESTFFTQGAVAHVSMADPICPHLMKHVAQAARAVASSTVHQVAPVTRGHRVSSFFWVESMVRGLEQQYDAFHQAQANLLADEVDIPTGEELGAQFEQFLAGLDDEAGER